MSRLPVIVGFGGINAAGRTSFHHGYRRMVLDSLDSASRTETLSGLATLMNLAQYRDGDFYQGEQRLSADALAAAVRSQVDEGTLVRRIEPNHFDVDAVPLHKNFTLLPGESGTVRFVTAPRDLPEPLPANWQVTELNAGAVQVEVPAATELKVTSYREFPVQAAGQLPRGFDPAALYNARHHPRGLQLTVFGASDAVRSMGIDWETVRNAVRPDQIAAYAGSAMSQLDENGLGGMLKSRLLGKRVSSKQCPLGLLEMPADFINGYILGSVGATGTAVGACATFLYNLQMAAEDIRSGRRRVVVVGNAEAPVLPEVAEGYAAMSALATAEGVRKILGEADHRRASRPFGDNCGFVLAESSQFVVLMDDDLALELGASIHGAVGDIYVNADGYKKSISAPGAGNFITMAKALAFAKAVVGEEAVRQRSFIQAHGSSTPQNRVTESQIFDEMAKAFGIERWPVAAVKAYLGHSLAVASGDQLMASLGVWRYGWIPGIKTIDKVADDVYADRLQMGPEDIEVGPQGTDVAFLNSKGFGGNNATGVLLAPHVAERMLAKKHGAGAINAWRERNGAVAEAAAAYDRAATQGALAPIYRFDHNVIQPEQVSVSASEVRLPGFLNPVDLNVDNPYDDMV